MAGSSGADKQLPEAPALRDAVEAIRELRKAYKRLLNKGSKQQQWSPCAKAHKVTIKALESPDLVEMVDSRTKELHRAGNGAPAQAREILRDADGTLINLEKRLARGAGFHNKELKEFTRRAPRMLKKAAGKRDALLPHVTKTTDLVGHLVEVHDLAHNVIVHPLGGKDKHSEQAYALKQIMRRLYLVASIVSNADQGQVFNYSYASGLGSAYVRDEHPRNLPAKGRLLTRGMPTP
jgi:hypothetical protein